MHAIPMSDSSRLERMASLSSLHFDIVIIGGGITGAGTAREASLAGLSVALLEAHDFASGTSSRSTKLFHGGLRYLEQAEFLLVREGGREREGMQRLAPHLVHPLPFLLPIYKTMKYGRFAMGTAVWLYDRLAQVDPDEQRVVLTRDEVLAREPGMNPDGLTGGVLYHEYLTDDARLVITVIKAAERLGALTQNYSPVRRVIYEDGRAVGVEATDRLTGRTFVVRAHVVVNAAGPWIEDILHQGDEEVNRSLSSRIIHSRGVHIVVPRARLPLTNALAVQTPDGRLMFTIPRGDKTFVGTTDEAYEGDLYHPGIEERDVEYLLDLVNGIFPDIKVNKTDIQGQWSGVRPLIHESGKATKDVSRKDQVWVLDSKLVTVAGGKLTAWRKMAEDVMETVFTVFQSLGIPVNAWFRERAKLLSPIAVLPGGNSIPPKGVQDWAVREAQRLQKFASIEHDDALHLALRYGDEAELVIRHAGENGLRRIVPDVPLLLGELSYMLEHESVVHLSDVIVRRTGLAWFGGAQTVLAIETIARQMGDMCGWDRQQIEAEVRDCAYESYWIERGLFAQQVHS